VSAAVAIRPDVIRSSSSTQYPDCGGRWAGRHVPHLVLAAGFDLGVTPSTIAALMGTATHAGGAYALKHKLEHVTVPPLRDAEEAALASFDAGLDKSKDFGGDVDWNQDGTTYTFSSAQQQIRRMYRVVHEQIVPRISPLAVEDKLEVDLDDNILLSGTLDYFARALPGDIPLPVKGEGIVDLKTGAEGLHVKQQGNYSLIRRSHGFEVHWLAIAHVPRISLKRPQPDANWFLVPLEYAEQAARRTVFDIKERILEFRATGDPHVWPRNPLSKLCSPRFCPAHPAHPG
jgi:hypothetical protein